MTTKLNCAVCGYTEVEGNICPNCATDLSLIRMLQQLPQVRGEEGERGREGEGERGRGGEEIASIILQGFGSAVCHRFAQGKKQKGLVKIAVWLGVTLFILTVGIGLGVVGCFLYSNPPGTSALVALRNSPSPSLQHWLLRTQNSATPVASTGGTPARRWLLSTQDF